MSARAAERGFSLLEVTIAIALTAGTLLALSAAVVQALHAAALADRRASLADDARNALADVRAVSAYDDGMLRTLAGRSATMSRPLGGATETIAVAIAAPDASGRITARATASSGGLSVVEMRTLYAEAPAPGSTVEETQ